MGENKEHSQIIKQGTYKKEKKNEKEKGLFEAFSDCFLLCPSGEWTKKIMEKQE